MNANDWTVFPESCFETLSSFSNDFADKEYPSDKPHCVAFTFPNKKAATEFAVFVERLYSELNGDSSKDAQLRIVMQAVKKLSICLTTAGNIFGALAVDLPTIIGPILPRIMRQIDPNRVKL